MAYRSLGDFLEALAGAGDLARVSAEVDPDEEIAEITCRTAQRGGPALLFERVRGHQQVVVTNLFGTTSRICRALGAESLDEFVQRLDDASASGGRSTWLDRLASRSAEPILARFAPQVAKMGPSQQVVQLGRDVDLTRLPALRSWPGESLRTMTAGQLILVGPGDEPRCWQRTLLPVLDRSRLAVLCDPFGGPRRHFERARASGEKLAMAVVLGGSPTSMLLADLPLGDGVDRLALAGLVEERPLLLVPARSQDVQVPAEAELVLEGYIDPEEPPVECGRLVVPGGLYHDATAAHAMHVTALTHRTNAAFPQTVFGGAPGEVSAVDRLAERLILAEVRAVVPEVVGLALPPFGLRRGFVVVAIRKGYPQQARKVASALWGQAALMTARTIVVVDEDVDVDDIEQVMRRVGSNARGQADVFFQTGPADPFDSTAAPSVGEKMGIDATAKLAGEHPLPWPGEAQSGDPTRRLVDERWEEYGLGNSPS